MLTIESFPERNHDGIGQRGFYRPFPYRSRAGHRAHPSAVPGVRDVLSCQRCGFSWLTCEPAAQTSAAYPVRFALSEAGSANAPEVPPVPEAFR